MREIKGTAKTIRDLLKGVRYSIDYYQREYLWQEKQILDLIEDLSDKFFEGYQPDHKRSQVEQYPHYFLGSIIISRKDGVSYIVDGQQRLTSLTLLLTYLRNLQKDQPVQVHIDDLIFSDSYGEKSFNIQVDERVACMEALFEGTPFDVTDRPESVQTIVQRYHDIEQALPEQLRGDALPYFIDWLLRNVHIVEITAFSDDDAYSIFETMNDRGLSLSPTEMLKGYLLANISDTTKRAAASNDWRDRIQELNAVGKDVEADFFKGWLRSQYALKIRERRRGAKPEDFDRIGSEFHRWLRDSSEAMGLKQGDDFYRFIERDFQFYSRQYQRILAASQQPVAGLERILYNAHHRFTLQNLLLLAPLHPDDSPEDTRRKLRIVAHYVDILLARRIWNFRATDHSTMQYTVFVTMRDIRGLGPSQLAQWLYGLLAKETETFASNDRLRRHQQNRWSLHRLLARLTDYVEVQSGNPSRYLELVGETSVPYEVEHIWANKPERHTDEFQHAADFGEYRNRIGGLLLLPKRFNASFGALPYEQKLQHYNAQNLLARSLHPQCYEHNPGFLAFVRQSGLPFRPHPAFKRADLDERGLLYRQLAERIWEPRQLLAEGS